MKFTFVRQESLSGHRAGIYSVRVDDESETLLERFLRENQAEYEHETIDILLTLRQIGQETGARETFFKLKEGKPGDGVEALYDAEHKQLRLYCIRNGRVAVLLGGGGPKPKSIRALQEDPKLDAENKLLRKISQTMIEALKNGDLRWSTDGTELMGNLTIDTDDY